MIRSSLIGMTCLALMSTAAFAAKEGAGKPVEVEMKNAKGEKVGTATLSPSKEGLKIALDLSRLAPGKHGIHFHENGKCEGPDFKSAGGHLNLAKKHHGLENPQGPHTGDLPNLVVGEDGTAKTEMVSHTAKLDKSSLLKAGGTSLMIHAGADDQKSDPAGNSGDRVACGVIGESKK